MAPNSPARRWLRAFREADALFAFRIAGAYLLFGAAWVGASDRLLAALVGDPGWVARLQTLKGWGFVLGTSVFLYALIRVALRARRRLKERHLESERFLDTLIGNLPGVVYACRNDAEWSMTYLSPHVERLTGHAPADLLEGGSASWASLIHPDDRDGVWREVQAALERREPFRIEYRILARGGETRWVWEQGRGVFGEEGELLHLEGVITDVTDRQRARSQIQRQVRKLRALRSIDVAIMGSLDIQVTLGIVLDQVTAELEVDAAAVLVADPWSSTLDYSSARGFRTDALRHTRLRVGEGHAGRAALERRTVRVADLRSEPGELLWSWLLPEEGFVSYLAVPLVSKGELRGVLEVFHRSALDPDADWLEFLESVAGQAAIAIDNAGLLEELERANMELRVAYDETIEGWARALDLRDRETQGHSRRVAEIALSLAERMGLGGEELVHLRRGALLHDIGKLGIPDAILLKAGPLTDDEWEVMRRHPAYAADFLTPVPFLRRAIDIPYCHHEKWDGSGYPRGLEGRDIPLAARVFAVADVWDALRSDRPYREAWSEDRVREHIRQGAGTHFDPDVAAAFLDIPLPELRRIEGARPPAGGRAAEPAAIPPAALLAGGS